MSIFTDTADKPLVDTELEMFGLRLDEFNYYESDSRIFAFTDYLLGRTEEADKFFREYTELTSDITMNDFVSVEYWNKVLPGIADIFENLYPASSWNSLMLRNAISNFRDAGQPDIPIEFSSWVSSVNYKVCLRSTYRTPEFNINIYYKAEPEMKPLIKSTLLEAKHI